MEQYVPTTEQCELALRAVQALEGDFAGVDLLFGNDEKPVICEINSMHILKTCWTVPISIPQIKYWNIF